MLKKNQGFIGICLLVVLVALTRWLPHPPNFSAVAALALFSGFLWKQNKIPFIAPLAVMVISDLVIGLHSTMFFVYGSFVLMSFLGQKIQKPAFTSVGLGAVGASVLFFFVTNFGVWMTSGMYAKTLQGLGQCFVAGIPFFHNTLGSTLLFSGVLFGAYSFLKGQQGLSEELPLKA